MASTENEAAAGVAARRLIRSSDRAALATSLAGRPYVSLVATACDLEAHPLLLLSDLAQHTKNLRADPRLSLLFEDAAGVTDPLAGARLTLLATADRCDEPAAASRFASRHPASAAYAGFGDFHLYRVAIERGHLVAGFGRISWIGCDQLRFGGDTAPLAAAEPDILTHMNSDHSEAIELYAQRIAGKIGDGWRMTGIDPEGLDLRRGGETARVDFAEPVLTPAAARRALVALAERARAAPFP